MKVLKVLKESGKNKNSWGSWQTSGGEEFSLEKRRKNIQ
jgi:hypothetical protein